MRYVVTSQFTIDGKTYHVGDLVTKDQLGSWFYAVSPLLKQSERIREVDEYDPLEGFLKGFLVKEDKE